MAPEGWGLSVVVHAGASRCWRRGVSSPLRPNVLTSFSNLTGTVLELLASFFLPLTWWPSAEPVAAGSERALKA